MAQKKKPCKVDWMKIIDTDKSDVTISSDISTMSQVTSESE